MKPFLLKLLFYTALFAGVVLAAGIVTSLLAHPYIIKKGRGSVIDKNERLASLPSPKIVLVGGSNVCYGINSGLLQDLLHLPVADMAINADIGMLFYFNQVKPYIQKGDIVIGIPEYGADEKMWGDESMYELAIADPRNIQTISLLQWLRLPLYMGTVIKDNYNIILSDKNAAVNNGRKWYNAFGDYEGHKTDTINLENAPERRELEELDTTIAAHYVSLVEDFNHYCKYKGALYLQSFPVYAKVQYNRAYLNALGKELPEVRFIGTPETYLYNYAQLYDSPNHLVFSMRDERTTKLANDIKQALHTRK
jgi:hypothetical protein